MLERVRFNVDVDTATPILVDNNVARAEINTDLRVVGTLTTLDSQGRRPVLREGWRSR